MLIAEKIDLDSFKLSAFTKSPKVKGIDQDFASKISEALDLKLLSNPNLNLEYGSNSSSSSNSKDEYSVSLGQPFRISNLGKRKEVARIAEELASNEKKADILEFIREISVGYLKVAGVQRQEAILRNASKRALNAATMIDNAAKDGILDSSQAKLFRAQALTIENNLYGLQVQEKEYKFNLSKLSGLKTSSLEAVIPDSNKEFKFEEVLSEIKSNPAATPRLVDISNKLAIERLNLSRIDSVQAITPRLGFRRTSEGDDLIEAGIQIPFPIWNQNNPEKIKRKAELDSIEKQQEVINDGTFENSIGLLIEQLNLITNRVVSYSSKVIPAYEDLHSLEHKKLESGQGSLLQLWEIHKELLNAENSLINLQIEKQVMLLQINLLTGKIFNVEK